MQFGKLILVGIALSLGVCGCSSVSLAKNVAFPDDGVKAPSKFPILRATGYASSSRQPGATAEIKQIKAMRASKLEAYRELTEQVSGIYVKAYENVNASTIETSSNVKAQVEGYVKGARVIRQYAIGDTYATELELDTRVVFDLYKMRGAL